MHVRRTDKIKEKESEFIPSTVFWKAAMDAEWRAQTTAERKRNEKLKVYISSEDAKVLPEFRDQFKDGEFVGYEPKNGKSLETNRSRHSELFGIIRDIWVLFNCDYVVGTFSSNVS